MSAADTIVHREIHALYSDHHGWLVGWLRRKLGCIHNANDLAHDTFLRVLAARTTTTDLREARAYLRTVAHGLMVDHLRRGPCSKPWLRCRKRRCRVRRPAPCGWKP